ncbi:zinc finger CCCH domain-containing protein 11A isoform X3 [Phyllopteryx taeniolatus]|nr:zinc finger CCCH domain-containing protein 11A isoform X3 [Phyllopteryx taeniolatus]XP_061640776.1 zinc finger CCCH domain-containing protein 11A isoform X3 [Phyllopteryx taeniolatus]XP_061640777.1 zinc finger CCCH domain-containing protein 11A isoform X3 [Phyllopteryx taeniolatus]
MTNHGDDCYFFYYSTCTKGNSCPFRHCEAAMGNETVCNLWQEGRCFRNVCKFRHMEITKKRKEIPCYWETHPAGCQKPHCAFFHEKPRYVDGILIPPDISQSENDELVHEEPSSMPATPLPTGANPQLRGVMKTESQEPVPSPTHPPVVINPADDDEDEDDQFSEEGEGPSPRKRSKPDESHNFGVSTLEDIRLRKALKAGTNRAIPPIQSADISVNGEKENIISSIRLPFHTSNEEKLVFEETLRSRSTVADRLGRQRDPICLIHGEVVPMKNSLAKRLGRFVKEENAQTPYQKGMKSIKERLTLPAAPFAVSQAAETSTESKSTPKQIHIKTLEEIRMEKSVKSRSQKDGRPPIGTEIAVTKTAHIQTPKAVKRAIYIKQQSIEHKKPPTELVHTKKKRKEDQQEQNLDLKKLKPTADKVPDKYQQEPAVQPPDCPKAGEVRVKTLEEIRKEKAARIQSDEVKSANTEENGAKKPRWLHNDKLTSQRDITAEKRFETKKTRKAPVALETASKIVKVKTFEEIMREKHLRKQEMAEQPSIRQQVSNAEPSPKPLAGSMLKRKILPPPGSSSPTRSIPGSNNVTPTPNASVCKLKTVKSDTESSLNNTTTAVVTTGTSVLMSTFTPPLEDTFLLSPGSSSKLPYKNTRSLISPSSAKQTTPERLNCPLVEIPTTDETHTTDRKVRPKLNVKPSVMKPSLEVNTGQKRKRAARSAVAAVKPLNSASRVLEESQEETARMDLQVLAASGKETVLRSPVSCRPSTLLEPKRSSSEEPQTIHVLKHSPSQETKLVVSLATTTDAYSAPQSSVLKTTPQSKSRRQSVVGSRNSTSAADDFEELINEFTDDHLDGDVDPGIGEDDLLQELSDMIDS